MPRRAASPPRRLKKLRPAIAAIAATPSFRRFCFFFPRSPRRIYRCAVAVSRRRLSSVRRLWRTKASQSREDVTGRCLHSLILSLPLPFPCILPSSLYYVPPFCLCLSLLLLATKSGCHPESSLTSRLLCNGSFLLAFRSLVTSRLHPARLDLSHFQSHTDRH